MRSRSALPLGRTPALEEHDRFDGARLAQLPEESLPIANLLDIGADDACPRIGEKMLEQFVGSDIEAVAQRHDTAEPQPSKGATAEDVDREPPALGQDPDRPGFGLADVDEAHPSAWRIRAHAVRPQQPDAGGRRGVEQRSSRTRAPIVRPESARHHLGEPHPPRPGAQGTGYPPGRNRDEGVVHRLGRLAQRRIGGQTLERRLGRMDRIDRPLVAGSTQASDEGVSLPYRMTGNAEHRDRLRLEERAIAIGKRRPDLRWTVETLDDVTEDETRVDRDGTVGRHDQRIDVDRREFAAEVDQQAVFARHGQQGINQCGLGGDEPASRALQHIGPLQFGQHLQRVDARDRADPERDVAEQFDEDAAEPDHDDLAEARVPEAADHEVVARRGRLFDQVAVDPMACSARGCGHRAHPGEDRGSILEAERHAADVGLVRHVRRDDLQHERRRHRTDDALDGVAERFDTGRIDLPGARHRKPVHRQDPLPGRLVQCGPTEAACAGDQRPRGVRSRGRRQHRPPRWRRLQRPGSP